MGRIYRKEDFKSGIKERVGDEKLIIIITNKCNCWRHKHIHITCLRARFFGYFETGAPEPGTRVSVY